MCLLKYRIQFWFTLNKPSSLWLFQDFSVLVTWVFEPILGRLRWSFTLATFGNGAKKGRITNNSEWAVVLKESIKHDAIHTTKNSEKGQWVIFQSWRSGVPNMVAWGGRLSPLWGPQGDILGVNLYRIYSMLQSFLHTSCTNLLFIALGLCPKLQCSRLVGIFSYLRLPDDIQLQEIIQLQLGNIYLHSMHTYFYCGGQRKHH